MEKQSKTKPNQKPQNFHPLLWPALVKILLKLVQPHSPYPSPLLGILHPVAPTLLADYKSPLVCIVFGGEPHLPTAKPHGSSALSNICRIICNKCQESYFSLAEI